MLTWKGLTFREFANNLRTGCLGKDGAFKVLNSKLEIIGWEIYVTGGPHSSCGIAILHAPNSTIGHKQDIMITSGDQNRILACVVKV